jgi:hypothetical protein
MSRIIAISKRIVSSALAKRIAFAAVRLGTIIFRSALSNAATALEALAKLFGKAVQDNAGAGDAPSKAVAKPATDSAAGSDSAALTVGKIVGDQVFSTDDLNGAGADDDQNMSFFKVLSHPSFVVDNIVLLAAFLRSFADTASVADAPALLSSKPFADAASGSDSVTQLTGLGKSDTLTAADAGQLLSQDYVDNALYFLDDYVGVKRTF